MQHGAGLIPFLIDWGESRHPADNAPGGIRLVALRGEHPAPETISGALRQLGIHLPIITAQTPALVATLDTPRGEVELR